MTLRAAPRKFLVLACAAVLAWGRSLAQESAGETVEPMEEVVVTGEFPGPGMWKVSRAEDPTHVLWIVGEPPPLPRRMQWKSRDVESVALRSQAILLDASVRLEPDEKIGLFRGLSLLPSAMKARKNPDERTLRDQLPADVYARWRVQKKTYLGRDNGVEEWRPIFAAAKLRKAAFDELELRDGGMVWDVVGKIAKKHKIPVTSPNLKFTFHTRDLKAKLREFSRESLADTECFTATLDLVDAISDKVTQGRRAHAWAAADLETLDRLPPLPNPYVPCAMAVLGSEAAREVIPADIREQLYASWMEAAAKALADNASTLAIVPLTKLTRAGGYLERLRSRGYVIDAPK